MNYIPNQEIYEFYGVLLLFGIVITCFSCFKYVLIAANLYFVLSLSLYFRNLCWSYSRYGQYSRLSSNEYDTDDHERVRSYAKSSSYFRDLEMQRFEKMSYSSNAYPRNIASYH